VSSTLHTRARQGPAIGLSAFVDADNRCTAANGYLRLAAPSPFLMHVLAVVGLLRRLEFPQG
jgi:hypothetical protein